MVYTIYLGLRREVEIHQSDAYRDAVEQHTDTESVDSTHPPRFTRREE
jgi:hypothetical protein